MNFWFFDKIQNDEIQKHCDFNFYRAQLKMYVINLRELYIDHSRFKNVTIKIVNEMQENEIKFVILNLIIHDHLNFSKLRNQMNVFCFRAMNNMYFVKDITSIMTFWARHRFHFHNLFIHCIHWSRHLNSKCAIEIDQELCFCRVENCNRI